jgi:hypothetical protein
LLGLALVCAEVVQAPLAVSCGQLKGVSPEPQDGGLIQKKALCRVQCDGGSYSGAALLIVGEIPSVHGLVWISHDVLLPFVFA